MESERSNNTSPRVPLTDEEEFDPQYESTINRSIHYYKIQPTAPTNSQGESAQGGSETCSLCNEPDPLFEPNGANLEPVVRLSCHHSFHLRCIIISLKKDTCPRCQLFIYLGEDDDARLNPQEEEDRVKKFFKELSNKPQDFNPLPVTNVETVNPTTPDMVFVELHNKILDGEKILKEKTLEVSRVEYEILDSHYPLGEALEKKLAELKSIHPTQTAKILLNVEIKRQFPSDMTRNVFNKKKRSAKNIYNYLLASVCCANAKIFYCGIF
ncbi:unnamed protein product [Rhizophagus irregularis]|uniref:RING-type domain-containing protein n=4 Tax=Rhizophagus irregularis TaxID=588596 RepID=A0A915ZZH4_9GLOM|nr:hypothetical protein GLOIN_2v1475865 [Rhizophagus irregularis DAOM 181602=DAOM 197198]EXX58530.1 hypothetical protein RirG_197140 [Rhizophagus irregularis DAOM 197198w]POG74832.1 hypothetical protein GLOIN_2v1475865 [Rhizophagus irregularis DAOM 181602=DAOM 197198]GET53888.1 hypothetical protein GLOIN_2v1475865 [Rhizophagus irregularis DAOM 181602=DAOM 197198]CAB5393844.1 unnamed protein product [Rhizophagus irregularis]|eukprot:XP_025181698.1 hypothetical protein GLOIN_2v1475865 [Rhizophagus irregularis DAOM 181602=DAOM 197198]